MPGLVQVFSDEPKLHQPDPLQQEANPWSAGPIGFSDGYDYAVFVDTLANEIQMWRSNDGWATKAPIGSALACAANTGVPFTRKFSWEQYAVDVHPSVPEVYVAYIGTDDRVRIGIFDLEVGDWAGVLTGGPDLSGFRTVGGSGPIIHFEMNYRLSNDQFIVRYEAWAQPTNQSRDEIMICTRAGAWGSPIIIAYRDCGSPPRYYMQGMVTVNHQDYSRTHLFFPAYFPCIVAGVLADTAFHRSMEDDNTLSSFQSLYTISGSGPNFEADGTGKPRANNETGEIMLPYWIFRSNGSNSSAVYLAIAISAAVPSWSFETVRDFQTDWNFNQIQVRFAGDEAITKILFSVCTAPELNDGRGNPYWDQDTECWYVETPSTPGRIVMAWREKRSGQPFTDTENLVYLERVSPGNWAAPQTLVLRSDYDPDEEAKRIYQIDLGFAGIAAVEAVWPERRKPRYMGNRA